MSTMRTSNIHFLLACAFTLAAGCDDAGDPAFGGDNDVTLRCIGPTCGIGGLGNTSVLGDHALSNMSMAIGQDAANSTAAVRIVGGTGFIRGRALAITEIDVEDDGELRLKLGKAGWIAGEAVRSARLGLLVTPNDPKQPAFTGSMLVADARCEPGKLDNTMTICRYEFVTDVVPDDAAAYPEHPRYPGYHHTCPDDDGGDLSAGMRFSAVLSPNVALVQPADGPPQIAASAGGFINGCLNGAVSKGQYQLNAFYDSEAYRGLDVSQRSAMLLMWMAWHDGESRTIPGRRISPHDPIGGLFTWTDAPEWDVEAGYGALGASCRGGSLDLGLHRHVADPVIALPGWEELPHCDAADVGEFAALGVKVNPSM